jgi:hypothetical protein
MRSEGLKKYIREHASLFWYTPENKEEKVTDALLVETILNYGNMEDVKQLFEIMGTKNVANIFYQATNKSERCKNNYFDLTRNFFNLYFSRYAS